MEKLKMHTPDRTEENFKRLAEMFPNAVTETINENGEVVRAIDADVLRQEISSAVVEGNQERYQFTWPDKKKSVVLSNQPIAKTLRLDREKSVGRDGTAGSIDTENIYIEGDNLDALKLLQETYLGKIKMIYIDPPYNTGSDFVYEDDFSQDKDEYISGSGQLDEQGNRLVANPESNGRFHTDWLNMLYPRLRIARDLLTDDGVIFISIDDNEQENLKKICDEIFGSSNFICNFVRKNKSGSGHDSEKVAIEYDYIVCYAKNYSSNNINQEIVDVESDTKYKLEDEYIVERGKYYLRDLDYKGSYSEKLDYAIKTPLGREIYSGGKFGKPNTWRWSKEKFEWGLNNGYIVFKETETTSKVYIKQYQYVDNNGEKYVRTIPYRALLEFSNGAGTLDFNSIMETNAFYYPKSVSLIRRLLNISSNKDCVIMDFFSGSATTAHAVMQLNAEDGGKRKFIMVQLPEQTPDNSEARKAGYNTICDIGEERIRRAGQKIKNEFQIANGFEQLGMESAHFADEIMQAGETSVKNLDIGFRVFRVDSSNMEDVYYAPADYKQEQLELLADNIKPDRTPTDLLFQVMLDLGITLSAEINETEIDGKKVFSVADSYLIACFDKNVTEQTVIQIAKKQPFYAVFRDSGMSSDSVLTNFEQIFETYSPKTTRKVL